MDLRNKQIRIAVIGANDVEDIEFILPVDVWRRAKFIVDVIVIETKNNFSLNYSGLKVNGLFNLKHTNLVQYDAIYLPGGPAHKSYLTHASFEKNNGESKLHVAIKKFFNDPNKWLIALCAAPISLMCILSEIKVKDIKFTCYNDKKLIGDFKDNWKDKRVVLDKQIITGQNAGCAFNLSYAVIECLTDLEYAKKIAKEHFSHEYHGINSEDIKL